jgi:hypothetical protein
MSTNLIQDDQAIISSTILSCLVVTTVNAAKTVTAFIMAGDANRRRIGTRISVTISPFPPSTVTTNTTVKVERQLDSHKSEMSNTHI